MKALKTLWLLVVGAAALPAQAQFYGGGMDTYGLWEPQSCSLSSGSQAERDACYGEDEDETRDVPVWSPPAATVAIPPAIFGFETSNAIRQSVYDRILNAQLQAQIKRENNGQSIIQQWEAQLRPYGLKTNNLADAMTVWALNAHGIISGDFSPPDPQSVKPVKAQFAFGLTQSGKLASTSDADKQRMADQLWVYSYGYAQGVLARETQPQGYRAAREAAIKHAEQLGIDFSRVVLTGSEGFRVTATSAQDGTAAAAATSFDEVASSYGARRNKVLEQYLANMKRLGRDPDPAIVAIMTEQYDEPE
ncbi:DUF6683 family protein [Parerythrobacter jejuensis]|nr:DUF6683 family protein [Parerythrobacter jejuensis]